MAASTVTSIDPKWCTGLEEEVFQSTRTALLVPMSKRVNSKAGPESVRRLHFHEVARLVSLCMLERKGSQKCKHQDRLPGHTKSLSCTHNFSNSNWWTSNSTTSHSVKGMIKILHTSSSGSDLLSVLFISHYFRYLFGLNLSFSSSKSSLLNCASSYLPF